MKAEVAAAAARGAVKGVAKNPDVAPALVTRAVSHAAGKAVDAATHNAPSADLAQAADPNVPLGDALGIMLRNFAYVVAAAYVRRLAEMIEEADLRRA